jgi:glucose/arabinose dehydrogenase
VIEKNTGKVKLVRNRAVVSTVLDLPVANDSERGLLSIALSPTFATDKYVYLYSTASTVDGGQAFDNRVDRYVWNGSTLALDRHIVRMPSVPGPNHNAGKITFRPRQQALHDHRRSQSQRADRQLRVINGAHAQRRGAALQPYGKPVANNPFFNPASPNSPINDIYAYGIRNSFGLDFDPISGFLWDSENGPTSIDELNLIRPGFNSGWEDIMGRRAAPVSLPPV